MQQDKDLAWKEFERTGSPVSYLTYRGISDTAPATPQNNKQAEKPTPETGVPLR